MFFYSLLAWIHWDPQRFAFTFPLIDRPVAWYGILFALGFILGFLILIPIFREKLLATRLIQERDIANWNLLINALKRGSVDTDTIMKEIYRKLHADTREALSHHQLLQEPSNVVKQDILRVLNYSMNDAKLHLTRDQIENLFPRGIFTIKELALYLTDRLTWFVVAGTIIGGRLGHVFFYEWPKYKDHPIDIIKVWEGGLASHGGAIAIMISLFIYLRVMKRRFPELTFVGLLDILAVPTALAATFIRVGNFFNQEILGPVSTVPWAIVFGHPYDGGANLPRHPTQLYEALAYFCIFCLLYYLWRKKGNTLRPGVLIGTFMTCTFTFRFFIEFLKTTQGMMFDESFLNTGQYLSIPFILMGLGFLIYPKYSKKNSPHHIKS